MPKGHVADTDYLALILNGTPIANIADNAASAPLTALDLAFHTAPPGVGGDQTTSEANFTGYARTPINRSNGAPQWTITSPSNVGTAKNTNPITGPTYTAGAGSPQTLTDFSLGVAVSGASKIQYTGTLATPLVMNPGETINIAALALVFTET